jgi:hypothetical protein
MYPCNQSRSRIFPSAQKVPSSVLWSIPTSGFPKPQAITYLPSLEVNFSLPRISYKCILRFTGVPKHRRARPLPGTRGRCSIGRYCKGRPEMDFFQACSLHRVLVPSWPHRPPYGRLVGTLWGEAAVRFSFPADTGPLPWAMRQGREKGHSQEGSQKMKVAKGPPNGPQQVCEKVESNPRAMSSLLP